MSFFSQFSETLTQSQDTFQRLGWLGILAYAGALVLLQMFISPLSPFGVAAGLIFGFLGGVTAVMLGTSVGAAINFLIARHVARTPVKRWLGHHRKFKLIDAAIGREGWKIVALLRFCPIPFGLANYAYGLTAIPFWPYFAATFFAIIPANCFFVWVGSSAQRAAAVAAGAENAQRPGEWIITGIGLVAFFLALRYITKIAKTALAKGETAAAVEEVGTV